MKITKVLMFLIIGILSLNLIYAGSIQKSFLIKGEFTIPNQGLGGQHPCDLGGAGDCKIFIYGPNSSTLNLAPDTFVSTVQNRYLDVAKIKSALSAGITTPVLNITSTAPTVDFTVKIMKGHSSYTTEVLSTVVSVPNPNASGTQISANILEGTATAPTCSSTENVGQIRIINGTFKICKNYEGFFGWNNLISGGTSGDGLQSADFNPVVFARCPPAGCYLGSIQLPQTADKMNLRNNSITNQYIAPGSISFSNLSQEVLDYLASLNTTNVTNVTQEVTEVVELDSDSVSLDHLDSDLKSRIGVVQEIPVDEIDDLKDVELKFYKIKDGGNTYYIPVQISTAFEVYAFRDLFAQSAFDSTYERNTSSGYHAGTFPLGPTQLTLKYSDYIYPRLTRKYTTTERYLPANINITSGGDNQNYDVTLYECKRTGPNDGHNEYAGDPGDHYNVTYCDEISSSRIKGKTKNSSLTFVGGSNTFRVTTDSNGNYSSKIHINGFNPLKRLIYANFKSAAATNDPGKDTIITNFSAIYNPITEIQHTTAATPTGLNCQYSVNEAGGYFVSLPRLQFKATGGSVNGEEDPGESHWFDWVICPYVGNNFEERNCRPPKTDNAETGIYNTSFVSGYNPSAAPVNVLVSIKDRRTGQRFARTFAISQCVLQN